MRPVTYINNNNRIYSQFRILLFGLWDPQNNQMSAFYAFSRIPRTALERGG